MKSITPAKQPIGHRYSDLLTREYVRRTITAALFVPLTIAVIFIGGWLMGAVLAILAAGGAYEFYRLASKSGLRPFVLPGCIAAGLGILLATARPTLSAVTPWLWLLTLALLYVVAAAAIWVRPLPDQAFAAIGSTLAGALWSGSSFVFLVLLRSVPRDPAVAHWSFHPLAGPALALFPVLLTWAADSAAYGVGHAWGRHRLLPRVSPGKTWEGASAGLVAAVTVGLLYAAIVFHTWLALPLAWWVGAIGGLVAGGVGPIGDLAKSVLKREAGVKNTGRLFPGHGGIIDRFDALFFSLPAIYWLVRVVLVRTP